jgi:hypothetical protein
MDGRWPVRHRGAVRNPKGGSDDVGELCGRWRCPVCPTLQVSSIEPLRMWAGAASRLRRRRPHPGGSDTRPKLISIPAYVVLNGVVKK